MRIKEAKPELTVGEDGNRYWRLNSKLPREDGPAVEWPDGTKRWFLNDHLHRDDGPAVEWANGDRVWSLNGKFHRTDGPAVECANGSKQWFLNGRRLSKEDFASLDQIIKMRATELFTPQEIIRLRSES